MKATNKILSGDIPIKLTVAQRIKLFFTGKVTVQVHLSYTTDAQWMSVYIVGQENAYNITYPTLSKES